MFRVCLAFAILIHTSYGTEDVPLDDEMMHPSLPLASYVDRVGFQKEYEDVYHWRSDARTKIRNKVRKRAIEKVAKNVIFFLGDGMSLPTITSSRVFKGQLMNLTFGEEADLSFDLFPFTGVSKTYCANSQVGDSACTATAYLCGSKGNYRTIGVSPDVQEGDCVAQMDEANHVSSILAWAQAAGKSTGIVTNTRVTHASPAGAYAHIANRNWEQDDGVESAGYDSEFCDDIAEQLVLRNPGRNINVVMGGGRSAFLHKNILDIEDQRRGKRRDGKNLIETWMRDKLEVDPGAQYITFKDELLALNTSDVDNLLGLFAYDHLEYADKLEENKDPSVEDMTRVAIEILKKNPKGYVLFVEGGKIDHAHHATNAKRAVYETLELDKAVSKAKQMTSEDDTLIVVTADHSHVMTMAGYPERGNSVFGMAGVSSIDGLPYSTLSYANGPGYRSPSKNGKRKNIRNDDMESINYRQMTTVPMVYETHGGDDVLIFSSGPFAHLLTGVNDQSFIPHAIGYAACIGSGETYCDDLIKASLKR